MSRLLYRWGRWSATRPWIAIGAWVLLSVLVVAASAGFGKQLDDSHGGARDRLPGRRRPAGGRRQRRRRAHGVRRGDAEPGR